MGLTKEGHGFLGKFLGPIERHLRAIECYTSNLSSDAGPQVDTNSYTTGSATLAGSGSAGPFNYTATDEIRSVELHTDTTGTDITVDIDKSDGSSLSFTVFSGSSWTYSGQLNEAPITSVSLTNNTANATDYIVNAVSVQ